MGDPAMTIEVRRTHGGLGRGLAALIPPTPPAEQTHEIALAQIQLNPYQPRGHVEESELRSLAESVALHGVLQPVLVIEIDGGYQLIAGERRVRAAHLAGLTTVPAVVRSADHQSQLALALVENLQRTDLNAMDEARAFRQLMDEFGLTQEAVAQRVGRSRPAIANTMRLLSVSEAIQTAVAEGRITEGHAKALAALESHDDQVRALGIVEGRGLSVRQTEELVRSALPRADRPITRTAVPDPDLQRMESRLRDALGTRVTLTPGKQGGRMTIAWFDDDELGRLFERLTGGDR
jgi:ParB family transcriptional regulator, chromosome partitioning protein